MLVDKKVDLSKMIEPNVKITVRGKQMPKVVGTYW
jgi:cell division protein FtsI (penicillin-binding protein 3)